VRRGRELTNLYRLTLPKSEKRLEAGERAAGKKGQNEPVKQVSLGDPLYPTYGRNNKRARAKERDAAPLKGAAASHRRAKEKTSRRKPTTLENYFAAIEKIEIEDDLDFDDDPSPDEWFPDPYADR